MRISSGRQLRIARPCVLELEARRLLSVYISAVAYDGIDLTGPTAAAGPDGYQSLHF